MLKALSRPRLIAKAGEVSLNPHPFPGRAIMQCQQILRSSRTLTAARNAGTQLQLSVVVKFMG